MMVLIFHECSVISTAHSCDAEYNKIAHCFLGSNLFVCFPVCKSLFSSMSMNGSPASPARLRLEQGRYSTNILVRMEQTTDAASFRASTNMLSSPCGRNEGDTQSSPSIKESSTATGISMVSQNGSPSRTAQALAVLEALDSICRNGALGDSRLTEHLILRHAERGYIRSVLLPPRRR